MLRALFETILLQLNTINLLYLSFVGLIVIENRFESVQTLNISNIEWTPPITLNYGIKQQRSNSNVECASVCLTENRVFKCSSYLYDDNESHCSVLTTGPDSKLNTGSREWWILNKNVKWNSYIFDPYLIAFNTITNGIRHPFSNLTASIDGSVTLANSGLSGKALNMTSDQVQYVKFENVADTCFGDSEKCPQGYTYSYWFKPEQIPNDSTFRTIIIGGGKSIFIRNRKFGFLFRDLEYVYETNDPLPVCTDGQWYHFVLTWKKYEGAVVYINGSESAVYSVQNAYTGSAGLFNKIIVGKPRDISQVTHYPGATGLLDELMFWSYKKESSQIKEIYQNYI